MTDAKAHMSDAVQAGREHIALLADAEGEHVFAREVRAGCWDHRDDVAAAISRATTPHQSERIET